jgi:hypothetical protein
MTSFIGWIGVDSRQSASVYLASDSRISWGHSTPTTAWDYGRKIFVTNSGAHILGYIGDVLFPSLVLAQVASWIDHGLLFSTDDEPLRRFERIQSVLELSFSALPNSERRPFTVVYSTRQHEYMKSTFHVFELSWTSESGWKGKEINTTDTSSPICVYGSGGETIAKWGKRWDSTSQGGTSRAVFSAFCDALRSGEDKYSGGAPQIACIYRKGSAKIMGIVWDNVPFVMGIPLKPDIARSENHVEWLNSKFERTDQVGNTLPDAKKHHTPNGLGQSQDQPATKLGERN